MKLRKARKAPKRFDDYEWEEEEEDREIGAPTTSPKVRGPVTRLRPHTLPYNPNLPPAAFPTLEYGVSRKSSSTMAAESPHAESLVVNSEIGRHIEWLRNYKKKAQKVEQARIPIPAPFTTPLNIQPDSMYDLLFKITAQRKTAEINYHQNHPGSDVYVRNIETLDKMAKRTADDWNIHEMINSDGEDSSPVICSKMKKVRCTKFKSFPCLLIICQPALTCTPISTAMASAASWEKLSIAHQLDMVHTLSGIYGTITEAMQQLRLDNFQSQRILDFIERYTESEIDEAIDLSALEPEKIKIILVSDSDRKHSRWVNVEKLTVSTCRELAKAKAYLESCGKEPTLLDHWRSLLLKHGSSCDENCQKLTPHLSVPAETDKVRSRLRSRLTPQPERPNLVHIPKPCEEAPSQKPLYKTSNSPITFLYPISPDSSPPARKFANVDGRKIARHSYPAAERRSAMPCSQRALVSQPHSATSSTFEPVSPVSSSFSPANSNFSPATSSFSSSSSSFGPNNHRGGRLGARMATKEKPVTAQRRKRVGLGS